MSTTPPNPDGHLRNDPLRPTSLAEFTGQPEARSHLEIIISGALGRGHLPDHLLFAGPPGLGKTTLATIVARELSLPIVTTSGPALERPGDVVGLLAGLTGPSVVFLDEIHALKRSLEELLYPAMEDGVIDVAYGESVRSKTIRLPIKPFVLIGATTQAGQVSAPLRDRFGYTARLKPYSTKDLTEIVLRSAALLEMQISPNAATEVALRARGTPRIANAWLRRVRDWAESESIVSIHRTHALDALTAFGIDELGLDELGREILIALIDSFRGGPVGVKTLSSAVNESPTTLEEVYEPYLMRQGLLARTPQGRTATAATYRHLGRQVPVHLSEPVVAAPVADTQPEPPAPDIDSE